MHHYARPRPRPRPRPTVEDPKTLRIRNSFSIIRRLDDLERFFDTIPQNLNIYKSKPDGVEKPVETIQASSTGLLTPSSSFFFSWNGLGKPFRTIQNLMLMHKLIGFIAFFFYSLVQNLSTQSLVTAVSSGWNRFPDTSRIWTRRSRISSPWISRGTNLDNSGSTRGSNPGTVSHPHDVANYHCFDN